MSARVTQHRFGQLPTGEAVDAYILTNDAGLLLQVTPYGGIVTRLLVPDRWGHSADVVLGFNELSSYLNPHPYFGAIAGRVAGRITGGRFTVGERAYELACNDPPNHLHGGTRGFDKQLWNAVPISQLDGSVSLRLSRISPDGEEGYPGAVAVTLTYTVTLNNCFVIDVEATSDAATPFNLTHHSYFNLAGEGNSSIEAHELQIHADMTAAINDSLTLLGYRQPVNGRATDLREPQRLGKIIPDLQGSHGDLYFIICAADRNDNDGKLILAARLTDASSGRVMTVKTTESCIQLYTGAALDGTLIGKSGRPYGRFAGVCLECQGYPDGANTPALGNIILLPGQTARQTTEYAFSTF